MPFSIFRFWPVFSLILFLGVNQLAAPGWAQVNRGVGPKPSLGKVGGGGTAAARPAQRPQLSQPGRMKVEMPAGLARPNPGASMQTRPNPSLTRPSFGNANPNVQRPPVQTPNVPRPNMQRPNTPRPNMQLPNTPRPNMQRPNMQLPNVPRPDLTNPNTPRPNPRPNIQLPTNSNLGGNRPSLGGIGGNPNITRPTTRPTPPSQLPNPPNPGGITRPGGGVGGAGESVRPGGVGGGTRPGATRPDVTRPSSPRPQKPTIKPPSFKPPINKLPPVPQPGQPGGRPSIERPDIRPPTGTIRPTPLPEGVTRPGITQPGITQPGITQPGITRPGITRPGTRPSRPGFGAGKPSPLPSPLPSPIPGDIANPGTRPSIPPVRPTPLPEQITRPDGSRPTYPNRPNPGDLTRPGFGRPQPPGFDKWTSVPTTRPVIGGNTNININQNNINQWNINNNFGNQYFHRPSWDFDPGFSRPTWGLGGINWYDRWHYNSIRTHYHWYNGCWHGYWGSNWYRPVSFVAVGWGLNSWANNWGYQAYYNPYYVQPTIVQGLPYNYAQPVVINTFVTADEQGRPTQTDPTPPQQQALSEFDRGLEQFQRGRYVQALARFKQALKELPGDAVVHEVNALAQFAIGDYTAAAAGLNSLMASAPGMDWTTMSSLYGKPDDYTKQLRKLETFAEANPEDAASHFVLAYHYLVLGSKEQAIDALRVVVQQQPRDVTAKRMLDALEPPVSARAMAEETLPEPAQAALPEIDPSQETDLVGVWRAEQGDSTVELTVSEDYQFVWKAMLAGQPTAELKGNLAGDAAGVELITAEQGTLAGTVISQGADAWILRLAEAPASDPGLNFERVK